MIKCRLFFAIIGLLIAIVQGQINLSGCPLGWVNSDSICYKFVSGDPRILEEAESNCWQKYGANLLSISSTKEHTFVSNWLFENDALFHSTWFTSGFYGNNILFWEGENFLNGDTTFWIKIPNEDSAYSRVAYKFNDKSSFQMYGWELVSGSIPSNYICEISQKDSLTVSHLDRDWGYGIGFVNPMTIPRGPKMIEEPVGVVVFPNKIGSIYLTCDADASPLAEYEWFKGLSKNNSVTSASNKRYTLSGGRLTIETPQQTDDAGFYSCSAENNAGKIISATVQIIFGYLHSFPPVTTDDHLATAFEGIRLSCFTPAHNPAVKYSWFKFHAHNYVFTNHPYHFVSQAGYLYFSEVQPTDGRRYHCVVTLDAPHYMQAENSVPPSKVSLGTHLIIQPGKTDGNYGPIIFTHVFPSPTLRGSTIRMECVAYGSLPLSYKWHRENGRPFVKGTKASARNRVLTITNAPLEAEGNYICTVKRRTASKSKVIVLSMEAKPYFANPLKNMLVDPGQSIKWRCMAVARPKATYSWYKNGKLITNIPGQLEAHGNYLLINNIEAERDEAMYQCAASNLHGTTFSSGQLKVLSLVPNFNRYPLSPYILGALGGNVTIRCKAEGAPLPQVQWLKNGGSLNLVAGQIDGRIGVTLTNGLGITDIRSSDQGTYTCLASNANGEARNSTFLEVVSGIVINKPPQPSSVVVNSTQFMYCAASYNQRQMDIAYEWQFNGHPINFRNNAHFVKGTSQGTEGIYIRAAQYTHGGKYTCVARTPLHSESMSAILTVRDPPGPPAGVYIDDTSVKSDSARVIWTIGPGTDHGSPIVSYDMEVESNYTAGNWDILTTDVPEYVVAAESTAEGLRHDQRTVVVSGLVPNTGYRFRVRATNQYGRGQEASRPSSIVKTPATAPIRAPADVFGGGGKVGTLNISWTPLPEAEHCGRGIGYKVYWKLLSEGKLTWKKAVLKGNHEQHVVLVGVDNYYIRYKVKVGVFNDLGDGPNSTLHVIYSAMGLPVAVPTISHVTSFNHSTVIVHFDPVPDDREHMKGRIAGYMIFYYLNDERCNPMAGCEPSAGSQRWRNIWKQTDHVMLIDLEPKSEYFFRMLVFNSAGWGPKGEWRRGETFTYAPTQYPMFVTVESNGPHSVIVSWRGVMTSSDEEIIIGYKVKVWEVQTDIRYANETESGRLETRVVIGGLQSKTVYELRVQGVSLGGDGAMSNSVYFTLKGGQIRIDPSTTDICYERTDTCNSVQQQIPSLCTIFLSICVVFSLFAI